MKKLIIFDCDGVLVDSEHLANQALVDCLADHQISMSQEEAFLRFKGRKLADCLLDIESTRNTKLPQSFEITFRKRMSEYFESGLRPIEGVKDAIERISHSKCVASNGPLEKMKRNLEITGLHHYFGNAVFSAYTIQKWKPEPDLFLHACKEMKFEPSNSIVVEDSEPGVQAALSGGFKVLAFGLSTIKDSRVTEFSAMSELPALVDQIFFNA